MLKPSQELIDSLAYLDYVDEMLTKNGVTKERREKQKEQLMRDLKQMAETGVPVPYSFD